MNTFTKRTFQSEFDGLVELSKSNTIAIPKVISFHENILELEEIVSASPTPKYWERLGRDLAGLHQCKKDFFGWNQSGYIGRSPQINTRENTWPTFFIQHRLRFQMKFLAKKPFYTATIGSLYERAEPNIEKSLLQNQVSPVLLHGDFWNGNVLCNEEQVPVFIDPAVYYGHSETDLAMMKLFGGFEDRTFEAYHEMLPKIDGWEIREKIYQLYHVLNHANIFGVGYLRQAIELIQQLQ